ncbi:MAG: protoporphyrinogen oxidase [Acidimicrobiales bacterium]|nr:protoporphyrinogen oxidase [Acidimicrobiales bacterium]
MPLASSGRVAVIGGGITGLVAARRLAQSGAEVTVLEAGRRLGGQVHTVQVAGLPVDVGAEALHLSAPQVSALVDELGLADQLIRSFPGSANIWNGDELLPLPAGVGPTGPTRLGPVVRSGILSPRGLARAAFEPLIPGGLPDRRDISVGHFLSQRFGTQVTSRLVDPVLGSLHAGDVTQLSLRAAVPQLAAVAGRHRSLVLARRGGPKPPPPAFATFGEGLVTLIDHLLDGVDVEVRTSARVSTITPVERGYEVSTAGGLALDVDAVVVALPAAAAASLLEPITPGCEDTLGSVRTASVATVVAVYPRSATDRVEAMMATGLLVPSSSGRALKAATFLSSKWPHLQPPDHFLVRLSAGRAGSPLVASLDDQQLAEALHADLAEATGLAADPTEVQVHRWPRALPQLEVGHLDRMAAVRERLALHPGLELAGASCDGIGIAACIASGDRAAAATRLATTPEVV